jgi:hypothetical protein
MSIGGNMTMIRSSLTVAGAAATLAALASLAACTTDAADPGDDSAGAAGSASGGTGGSSSSGAATGGSSAAGSTSAAGTVCAKPFVMLAAAPGVADFEDYDGVSDLAKWSFPLGGDTASGVLGGTFGYGDRPSGSPETFEMGEGYESKYGLRIADTLAEAYGGGMGTWLSACLDATAFSGVSFWARGSSPKGTGKLTLSMGETTPATPAKAGDKVGTCDGDMKTCLHPTADFDVADTWTEIKIPWAGFTAGDAAGTPITPDGSNVTQLQFAVELNWVPDDAGEYAPVAAPYELVIDGLTFY